MDDKRTKTFLQVKRSGAPYHMPAKNRDLIPACGKRGNYYEAEVTADHFARTIMERYRYCADCRHLPGWPRAVQEYVWLGVEDADE